MEFEPVGMIRLDGLRFGPEARCRVVRVDGLDVHVEGLDAVDGTPVLDLKPYMAEFGPRGELRQPEWATALMRDYYAPSTSNGSSHGRKSL